MMNKVLVGIVIILVIACLLCGVLASMQRNSILQLKETNQSLQNDYDLAKTQNETLKKVNEIGQLVTSQVTKEQSDNTAKMKELTSLVDETTRKVAKHEITPDSADVVYTNSMWSAYCQAGGTGSHCSTGKPVKPMSH